MATEVTLPALGESVTEGTVTRWLKQVGESVAVDEALLEVSTDKVDTEIPSPVAGTLLEIKAAEDETVEVGAILAVIGAEGESSGGGESSAEESSGESEAAEDEGDAQAETEAEEGAEEGDSEPEQPAAEEPQEQEQPAAQEQSSEGESSGGSSGSGKTTSVTLPALGESVTEGTVTRWLKQVGDDVAVDEALLEVSTDKVDTEIPSPVAGTLLEIKVNEDETVEVGAELAVIGEQGAAPSGGGGDEQPAPEKEAEQESEQESEPEQPAEEAEPEPEQKSEPEPAKEQPAAAAEPAAPAAAPEAPSGRDEPSGYVTPLVRKMASQHNVDLASVTGTGVGGRIRKQDVLDAAAQQGTTAPPPTAAAQAAAQPAAPAAAAAPAAPGPRHRQHRQQPRRRPCRRRCAGPPRRCPGSARSSPPG